MNKNHISSGQQPKNTPRTNSNPQFKEHANNSMNHNRKLLELLAKH